MGTVLFSFDKPFETASLLRMWLRASSKVTCLRATHYAQEGQRLEPSLFSIYLSDIGDPYRGYSNSVDLLQPHDIHWSVMIRRRNSPVRLAVYYHLVERCGMSVTNTAKATDVSINAVSKGIKFFKEIMENHKEISASINQLSLKWRPDPNLPHFRYLLTIKGDFLPLEYSPFRLIGTFWGGLKYFNRLCSDKDFFLPKSLF